MPDEPQGRNKDGVIKQVGPVSRADHLTPEEVAEPGRKRNAPDPEWLSMATTDPAHFLNDLHPE